MKHQINKRKLNVDQKHRKALLRNQVITLIMYGSLTTTKARVKEVRKFAERLVTMARKGNTYQERRKVRSLLPYKEEALDKLFTQIAPQYVERPGGYTRIFSLGRRTSDTAEIARLEWVM